MPSRLDIPPVYFLASALLMLLLHFGPPVPQLVHWPWRWLGLLPVVGGSTPSSRGFGHSDEPRHAVSGVGDGAYVMYPKPQNEYQDTIGLLVVPVAGHTLGITGGGRGPAGRVGANRPDRPGEGRTGAAALTCLEVPSLNRPSRQACRASDAATGKVRRRDRR